MDFTSYGDLEDVHIRLGCFTEMYCHCGKLSARNPLCLASVAVKRKTVHYERATLLKQSLHSGKQEASTDKNTKLVPLEITIPKPFNDVTYEDCHCLQVRVLSTAYGIPEESITYYEAEEHHSTTITYLIPRQYIGKIMQRSAQLETVRSSFCSHFTHIFYCYKRVFPLLLLAFLRVLSVQGLTSRVDGGACKFPRLQMAN